MVSKTKLIFDVTPEEKEWLENTIMANEPGETKIGLLRRLLDDYAKKRNLPSRPNSSKEDK